MNNVYYVGIDPSLNSTGLVIFQEPTDILVAETFSANNKEMGLARFKGYDDGLAKLADLFEICEVPPCAIFHIAVESPAFAAKGKRSHHLAEWNGICKNNVVNGHWTLPVNIVDSGTWKVYEIPPTSLKKFMTDKGNASKSEMAYSVKKKYNVDFGEKPGWSDKVDAFALACYAMDQSQQ